MFDVTLQQRVNDLAHETIQLCYHCHKCTAGCPVEREMTYGPDIILRMVQLGQKQEVLSSPDIWLCAGCETCGTRCPNDIDIAHIMDALRQIAVAENIRPAVPNVKRFHDIFLYVVGLTGEMYEAGLMGAYELLSGDLFKDPSIMALAANLFVKGKIPVLPQFSKSRARVQRVIEQSRQGNTVTR
jgi:heterodisulfide reductase subunit C